MNFAMKSKSASYESHFQFTDMDTSPSHEEPTLRDSFNLKANIRAQQGCHQIRNHIVHDLKTIEIHRTAAYRLVHDADLHTKRRSEWLNIANHPRERERERAANVLSKCRSKTN